MLDGPGCGTPPPSALCPVPVQEYRIHETVKGDVLAGRAFAQGGQQRRHDLLGPRPGQLLGRIFPDGADVLGVAVPATLAPLFTFGEPVLLTIAQDPVSRPPARDLVSLLALPTVQPPTFTLMFLRGAHISHGNTG